MAKEVRASVGVGPVRILTGFALSDIFWGLLIGALVCGFGWFWAKIDTTHTPPPAPAVTTTYSRP